MNPCYSLLAVLLLGACAGPPEPLVVKQFQLRDQVPNTVDEPMVSMEKSRRLRGAVSMEERRNRLGQYYTLIWDDRNGVGQGEVELILQYQQGGTASLVKRMVRSFPASTPDGKAEFAIIGEDYFKNGKVLTWKATLQRGKKVIATKQSYLWQ
ncbi:MAG: hypothetical protein ABIS50_24980 [Luteolibacter sp.]|uniref:hypothetical protein n=1 Tax=Luteolibacter sp. TaxID=1962973 RepID=UPI00326579CB